MVGFGAAVGTVCQRCGGGACLENPVSMEETMGCIDMEGGPEVAVVVEEEADSIGAAAVKAEH